MKRHIKTNPVTAEDCLRKEFNKSNVSQAGDISNKHIDDFGKLYEHEQPMRLETEAKSDDMISNNVITLNHFK